jgi:hypothetical protein
MHITCKLKAFDSAVCVNKVLQLAILRVMKGKKQGNWILPWNSKVHTV